MAEDADVVKAPSQGKAVLISSIPLTGGLVLKMASKGSNCLFFSFSKGDAKDNIRNNFIKIFYIFPLPKQSYVMMYGKIS